MNKAFEESHPADFETRLNMFRKAYACQQVDVEVQFHHYFEIGCWGVKAYLKMKGLVNCLILSKLKQFTIIKKINDFELFLAFELCIIIASLLVQAWWITEIKGSFKIKLFCSKIQNSLRKLLLSCKKIPTHIFLFWTIMFQVCHDNELWNDVPNQLHFCLSISFIKKLTYFTNMRGKLR